ncbi:hypothetical protein [Cryocola sp. 340MFSha3.1]|uniref:hypothetical protein n=1 Tax=Cryocola sp. 340MFSha3.1 TaxID=1169145 RepID=UPI00048F278A|nr:hypothetical protein [Cryocola sp. 340MFSha3.1]
MNDLWSTWGFVVILVALATPLIVVARRRYLHYSQTVLSEDVLDEMADYLIGSLRGYCGGPDRPMTLPPALWLSFGWTHAEILRVIEYAVAHGWLTVPNFTVITDGVIWNSLPRTAALTPDSYERWSPREPEEPRSITFNGLTHLGDGDLVNNGKITFEWTVIERDVSKLALSLHRESLRHEGELAQHLEEAAETLSRAVEEQNLQDPWVRRTVRWVADLANGTTANLISAGLVAAATALLGKL